jgi:hypothetical protein
MLFICICFFINLRINIAFSDIFSIIQSVFPNICTRLFPSGESVYVMVLAALASTNLYVRDKQLFGLYMLNQPRFPTLGLH